MMTTDLMPNASQPSKHGMIVQHPFNTQSRQAPWVPTQWMHAANPLNPGVPTAQLVEHESQYVVKVALQDWKPEQVTVTYFPGLVMVEGKAEAQPKQKNGMGNHHKRTLPQPFALSFALPGQIELDKIAAEFKNSLLSITLPKSEVMKSCRIKITTHENCAGT